MMAEEIVPPPIHSSFSGSFLRDVRYGGRHFSGALEATVAGEWDSLLPRVNDGN